MTVVTPPSSVPPVTTSSFLLQAAPARSARTIHFANELVMVVSSAQLIGPHAAVGAVCGECVRGRVVPVQLVPVGLRAGPEDCGMARRALVRVGGRQPLARAVRQPLPDRFRQIALERQM